MYHFNVTIPRFRLIFATPSWLVVLPLTKTESGKSLSFNLVFPATICMSQIKTFTPSKTTLIFMETKLLGSHWHHSKMVGVTLHFLAQFQNPLILQVNIKALPILFFFFFFPTAISKAFSLSFPFCGSGCNFQSSVSLLRALVAFESVPSQSPRQQVMIMNERSDPEPIHSVTNLYWNDKLGICLEFPISTYNLNKLCHL